MKILFEERAKIRSRQSEQEHTIQSNTKKKRGRDGGETRGVMRTAEGRR